MPDSALFLTCNYASQIWALVISVVLLFNLKGILMCTMVGQGYSTTSLWFSKSVFLKGNGFDA